MYTASGEDGAQLYRHFMLLQPNDIEYRMIILISISILIDLIKVLIFFNQLKFIRQFLMCLKRSVFKDMFGCERTYTCQIYSV